MNPTEAPTRRAVVIGGGIAGLAAAYALRQGARAQNLPLTITLYESQPRLGGKIVTEQVDGFTIEGGPDSYIRQKPWATQLIQKLGLSSEIAGTNDDRRKVFVVNRGRLTPLPDGVMLIIPTRIWPFVTSPLISWPGKIRMGMDWFIPARPGDDDESLGDFIRRRLGREALEKIAEPLMSGIHVSDPEMQSLLGTFPRFREIEKKYGSLTRGMLAQRKAAQKNGHGATATQGGGNLPTSMFLTLRGGLAQLVTALEQALAGEEIRAGCAVTGLTPLGGGRYRVDAQDGSSVEADAVILASPAFAAGALVLPFAPELGRMLNAIRYVSTATISLAFREEDVKGAPQGFGFVVPKKEARQISACTMTSIKFSHRAPDGAALLRCFVGGPGREAMVDLDDKALVAIARAELADLMNIRAEPLLTRIYRWHQSNPQYDVGHLDRVRQMHELCRAVPGLYLAGGAYEGVGIPDCVRQGEQAAQKALAHLTAQPAHEKLPAAQV